MSTTFAAAWDMVNQLSDDERGVLAERLFESAPEQDFGLSEEAWEELERRLCSLDDGTATLIEGTAGLQGVREALAQRRQA